MPLDHKKKRYAWESIFVQHASVLFVGKSLAPRAMCCLKCFTSCVISPLHYLVSFSTTAWLSFTISEASSLTARESLYSCFFLPLLFDSWGCSKLCKSFLCCTRMIRNFETKKGLYFGWESLQHDESSLYLLDIGYALQQWLKQCGSFMA